MGGRCGKPTTRHGSRAACGVTWPMGPLLPGPRLAPSKHSQFPFAPPPQALSGAVAASVCLLGHSSGGPVCLSQKHSTGAPVCASQVTRLTAPVAPRSVVPLQSVSGWKWRLRRGADAHRVTCSMTAAEIPARVRGLGDKWVPNEVLPMQARGRDTTAPAAGGRPDWVRDGVLTSVAAVPR